MQAFDFKASFRFHLVYREQFLRDFDFLFFIGQCCYACRRRRLLCIVDILFKNPFPLINRFTLISAFRAGRRIFISCIGIRWVQPASSAGIGRNTGHSHDFLVAPGDDQISTVDRDRRVITQRPKRIAAGINVDRLVLFQIDDANLAAILSNFDFDVLVIGLDFDLPP